MAKNYHTGVDIGMAQGTEILAGHDGTVTRDHGRELFIRKGLRRNIVIKVAATACVSPLKARLTRGIPLPRNTATVHSFLCPWARK